MQRKIYSLVLIFVQFLFVISASGLFASLGIYANQTEAWDGSVASSFESGSGSKSDPYIIKNASQLAYLSKTVSSGESYEGKYIKLISDIVLNDESFVFDADSGLIKATDDVQVIYIGTGIKGDGNGDSNVFDIIPSELGRTYASSLSESGGKYSGKINSIIPIGKEGYPFSGTFDGNGNSISGAYIRSTTKECIGVFGYIYEATIKNLSVEKSFVLGKSRVGGIIGEANRSSISACNSSATVCGVQSIGGLCGSISDTEISSSYNVGTVCGSSVVGGVVGANIGSITDVYNAGKVIASMSAGGIVGVNGKSLKNCYNSEKVICPQTAGAIAASGSGLLENAFYVEGSASGIGTAINEENMKNSESFVGFDFENVWEIGVSGAYAYPTLISVKHSIVDHIYDNDCDAVCNSCGAVRETSHSYGSTWTMSDEFHFRKCSACGEETDKSGHVYDDACDSICNVCKYDRNVFHNFNVVWSSDKNLHWHECTACGEKKDIENHVPGKEATSTSPQICKICQYVIKEPTGHKHSFTGEWKEDKDGHYKECSCGEKSSVEPHKWNEGEITVPPTEESEGVKTFTCTLCSAEKTEKIDKLDPPTSDGDGKQDSDSDADGKTQHDSNYQGGDDENADLVIAISVASLGVSALNLVLFAVAIVLLLKKRK